MSVPEESSSTGGAYFLPATTGQVLVHLRAAQARIDFLEETLRDIQAIAHDHSTGPTVPDTLWEIRGIAQSVL